MSIRESRFTAEELIARAGDDLDAVTPTDMASFEKVRGTEGGLRVGDEYVVRMPGPWDGPVRVVETTPDSFRLATLKGHLEAGQIEFRAHQGARSVEFVIESWARSGDRFSDLMYAHLRMSKEVQLHMWTSVIERVVEMSGGRMHGGIRVVTRSADPDAEAPARDPQRPAGRGRIDLRERQVNLDTAWNEMTIEDGWRNDDLTEDLPGEAAGEPQEGGSFQTARKLMDDYQVADPGRVSAVFDRQSELEGRNLLLQIRFLLLRFHVGVRVGTPYDELRCVDDRQVRVWGWSYRTLQGHFEMGEMHYQLWKWLDDGHVEFRIAARSRPADTGPLWLRLGFRLVGRRQQLAYYRSACRRMRRLTESELEMADVRRRDEHSASAH